MRARVCGRVYADLCMLRWVVALHRDDLTKFWARCPVIVLGVPAFYNSCRA